MAPTRCQGRVELLYLIGTDEGSLLTETRIPLRPAGNPKTVQELLLQCSSLLRSIQPPLTRMLATFCLGAQTRLVILGLGREGELDRLLQLMDRDGRRASREWREKGDYVDTGSN